MFVGTSVDSPAIHLWWPCFLAGKQNVLLLSCFSRDQQQKLPFSKKSEMINEDPDRYIVLD
jgi:hypothetical protein